MAPNDIQEPEPRTFEFITVQNPDEGRSIEMRTKVKKHVMRDIGRSRRRPKKSKNPLLFDVVLDPQNRVGSSSTDPFASYPRELNDNEQELVNYIFEDAFDNPQRAYRNEWFALGQIDLSTFNIILSNAASHRDQLAGLPHGQRSLEAERYHLLALQSLNQRLAGPNLEITDGLVGAITGFIVHNEIIGDFEQWAVHHAGIVRLVNMRGGIDNLKFRQLRETISWIEIRGCFPQDRRPFFPLPSTWIERIQALKRYISAPTLPVRFAIEWNKLAPSSTGTYASYQNLDVFSWYASKLSQETEGRMWLKDEYTGNWVTLLMHVLCSRYGDDPNSKDRTPAQEAIRLASMLYLANVWRKYGCGPVRTFFLADKLLRIHAEYDIDWQGCWQIQAWTLLMGVIETGGDMRTGFLDKLRELANTDKRSIQEVILQAKKVVWLSEALPAVDTILITETMDWTMKRCLKDGTLEMPWEMATLSLETRRAFGEQVRTSQSPEI